MNILITGATGFIGSHFTDLMISEGHNIYCLVRKSSNLRWLNLKKVNLVTLESSQDKDFETILSSIDYVYHFAGTIAARKESEYFSGNQEFTEKVINLIIKYSKDLKRFVHISSQAACGPSNYLNNPLNEDSNCNPITAYGRSKLAAELVVLKYKDIIPITIIRPPAVYGPRDEALLSEFKLINYRIGILIGFKEKYASLIYVSDLIKGIKLAGESKKSIGEIYFISSKEFYTWNKFIEQIKLKLNKKFILTIKLPHFAVLLIAAITGFASFSSKPSVLNYEKGLDLIQEFWICSIEKAEKDLKFIEEVSLEEGIEQTIKWYKENKWL